MKKTKISDIFEGLRAKRPASVRQMRNYISAYFDVKIPHQVITTGHSSPIEYMWYSFNIDFKKERMPQADCVVWACRGGGKTQNAGLLTLLDCIFKPNIQIRILSGSGYQAGRMYEYFEKYLNMGYRKFIECQTKTPNQKTTFINGSNVEVFKQSETNVRGPHVQKLRCDEIELFKKRVYDAAQYTTMSTNQYIAAIEYISTKHNPYGLMRKLIKASEKIKRPVFKWNLWDVIEECKGRKCSDCTLEEYCLGKAKAGDGYYKIDDAISQMERTKPNSFIREMLCDEGGKKKGGIFNFKERLY